MIITYIVKFHKYLVVLSYESDKSKFISVLLNVVSNSAIIYNVLQKSNNESAAYLVFIVSQCVYEFVVLYEYSLITIEYLYFVIY